MRGAPDINAGGVGVGDAQGGLILAGLDLDLRFRFTGRHRTSGRKEKVVPPRVRRNLQSLKRGINKVLNLLPLLIHQCR